MTQNRLSDKDGQFLLIEAALFIPKWLTVQNSNYRIWLKDGRILFIPVASAMKPPSSPSDIVFIPDEITNASDALQLVMDKNIRMEASEEVQKAIIAKIKE